jgi:hypothetical protein
MKKFNYSIESGLTRVKTRTKKYVAGVLSGLAVAGGVAMPVMAAQPTNPGCFGRDRAAVLHQMQDDAFIHLPSGDPGASEWGKEAARRAGTNGQVNRAYVCQP